MPATRRALTAGALGLAAPPRVHAQPVELAFAALFPLSGPHALLGDEAMRGLALAVEARNAAGGVLGRAVRLQGADIGTPAEAQAAARRFAAPGPERAVAAFGTLDAGLALAATQAAELDGLPYVELLAPADALTERGFRLLVRTCPRATDLATLAAVALAPGERAVRLGVLHAGAAGAEAIAAAAATRLREAGQDVAETASYAGQPAEMLPAIRRLRAAGVEALLHCGRGTDAVALFRALAEAGWRPARLVGLGGGHALAETAQAVGPAIEGLVAIDLPQPDAASPGAVAFAGAYRRRYGAEPRAGHSLAAFAGAQLTFDAATRAGATEPGRLRAAFAGLDVAERSLANGWGARFDERGQNARAFPAALQWRGGRRVMILPEGAAAG